MKRRLIILILLITLIPIAQAQQSYEGLWYSDEAGMVLHIQEKKVSVFAVSEQQCVEAMEFVLEGSTLLEDGNVLATLSLENGELQVLMGDEIYLTAEPIEALETICQLTEITLPTETLASLEEVDSFISEVFAQAEIPGMAVAIVAPGRVLWSQGYGFASVESQQPVTSDTPFMLASVTKTFTGTALLQAWEEGKIGLDDPINTLLPFEVNNPYTESEVITVRHLATHTSGLLDNWPVYGSLYVPGDSPIALGDFLQGYLVEGGEWYDAESNFADRMPGEEYEYSNVGAALSGYLVEATTGTPLDDYAEAHIFAPLGMTNTHWHLADYEDTSVIAVPYDADGTPLDHYGYPTWPDGQLRSSANDLGRFLAALLNGGELEGARVLSEATVAMMLTPQIPEASTTQGWFWITDTSQGYLVAQHGGGDLGVSTLIAFSPDLNIGLVILTNTDDMITSPLGDALTSVIFNSSENLIR